MPATCTQRRTSAVTDVSGYNTVDFVRSLVAVWRGSTLLLDRAYGAADLESEARALPSTEFLIG